MEARVREEKHHGFYGSGGPDFLSKERDLVGTGKKSLEWDLNDWKWDGDLFVASPLNSVPTSCKSKQFFPVGPRFVGEGSSNSSSSCSDEINVEHVKGKGELEKRRVVVIEEDDELNGEAGSLALKLGGNVCPTADKEVVKWEEKNGKKAKLQGTNSSHSGCQVEGCGADLSNAKDYHRRHKVCEMHAKASNALVGNAMQRFCQQCSRFHLLQEFDEGKRSCRRRLAGHNRRRRKTNPDAGFGGTSLNDSQAGSYLLLSLLRILSNLHSNHSDQSKDQDLLRNLASIASTFDGRNLQGLLQVSQDLRQMDSSLGTSSERVPAMPTNVVSCVTVQDTRPFCSTSNLNHGSSIQDSLVKPVEHSISVNIAASGMPQEGIVIGNSMGGKLQAVPSTKCLNPLPVEEDVSCSLRHMLPQESTEQRVKIHNFDLNNIYNESQDCLDESERTHTQAMLATDSLDCPSWVQQDSHHSSPHTSGNSDSACAQSPSSSSGDVQSRTDRIVFKLFGKDPNDFPRVLRTQILDWLSHSPTDIESYIRPGCIILTIYLCLAESTWEELCCNLSSSLNRLLDISGDPFWQTGWLYARIHHQIAFVYNGQVLLNSRLPQSQNCCRISSVRPLAVSVSERANFVVRGFNLSSSTTRLLCAFEGMYITQEIAHVLEESGNTSNAREELQCITFSCSLPSITGRGFIEVEDDGLSSVFFPFIVAEQDICSEICVLECAIEMTDGDDNLEERALEERAGIMKARKQALEFLHEMGWLLRKNHLRSRLDHIGSPMDFFSLSRFKWLVEFSMDHDWCAVVKKLLDILFGGAIDSGENSSELILSEMALLHRAVRRNCRPMVELLLRYVPGRLSDKLEPQYDKQMGECSDSFLFRPDMAGPGGVTPLHAAASRDDAENVLDALTDDPGQVGIGAWSNAQDKTGFAPQDYARMRGYFSYIHLVRRKTNKRMEARHVIVDMPTSTQSQTDSPNFRKSPAFQIEKSEPEMKKPYCKLCSQQLIRTSVGPSLLYRPAMLSMVAIAAVCVCVGLLLKGPPDVLFVFPPFRWELLDYGSQ